MSDDKPYREKFCRYGRNGQGHFVDSSRMTWVKSEKPAPSGYYICDDCAPKVAAARAAARERTKVDAASPNSDGSHVV